jgi:cbb3-type cytochrome c oxidase subunit III
MSGDKRMTCRLLLIAVLPFEICVAGNANSTPKAVTAAALGISFIEGSTSALKMQRDGRTYLIDVVSRTVREIDQQPGGAASPPVASQSEGATIFRNNCARCHGPDGRGLAGLGTPNFTDPKLQATLTDEQIRSTIRNGKPGTIMPAWRGTLSDQQIESVATYARSLGAPGGAAPAPPPAAPQAEGAAIFQSVCARCHGADGKGLPSTHTPNFTSPSIQTALTDQHILDVIRNGKPGTIMPAWSGRLSDQQIHAVAAYVRSLGAPGVAAQGVAGPPVPGGPPTPGIYQPGDDLLFTLPTGRLLDPGGFYVNFTHRFAFDPAFNGVARGAYLMGLDGFALASFGFRYGVTKRFSIAAFRSPTFIARPINLMLAYNFLSESDHAPLNITGRFSVEGQNNFSINFAENFEIILSKSLFHGHGQVYLVPTFLLNARRLFQPAFPRSRDIPHLPGFNTITTGLGGALDVRPTVAVVAEINPTWLNFTELGIHNPVFAFGVQKKIWRHAFTIGFTNGPGVTVAQRNGTRGSFIGQPNQIFIGFDLMRQLH